MRRLAGLALAILAACAGAAVAEGPERRLLSAEAATAFRGVGRVNIAGSRFCTGTLIAPDEVLTAAHCLYHPETRRLVPASEIRFVAGLRIGAKAAVRRVVQAVAHPDFAFEGMADPDGVQADLALLRLGAPIPAEAAGAFEPGALDAGEVSIVSYARDRPQAPSREAPCGVLSRFGDVVALDCAVTYGASGAPVLQGTGDGLRVVAVVSAMGRTLADGTPRDVTLAALVMPSLAVLRARMEAR